MKTCNNENEYALLSHFVSFYVFSFLLFYDDVNVSFYIRDVDVEWSKFQREDLL